VTAERVRTRTEPEPNRPNAFGEVRFGFGEIPERFGAFGFGVRAKGPENRTEPNFLTFIQECGGKISRTSLDPKGM
jgi:hypothetical protein